MQSSAAEKIVPLAERINDVMATMGWNKSQLARIAGASAAAVGNWVHGRYDDKQQRQVLNPEYAKNIARETEGRFAYSYIATGRGPREPEDGGDPTLKPPVLAHEITDAEVDWETPAARAALRDAQRTVSGLPSESRTHLAVTLLAMLVLGSRRLK